MSTVRWHVMMSLDGFIADEERTMGWLTFDWLPPRDGMPPAARRAVGTTGAVLAGRHWYEETRPAGGSKTIFGGAWRGPVIVMTHRPEPEPYDPAVTFASGDITAAVATAREAAAAKDVLIFGADLARQAFTAGLVDEVLVHVAPRLLGAGLRLDGCAARLEPLELASSGHTADLHYRVVR